MTWNGARIITTAVNLQRKKSSGSGLLNAQNPSTSVSDCWTMRRVSSWTYSTSRAPAASRAHKTPGVFAAPSVPWMWDQPSQVLLIFGGRWIQGHVGDNQSDLGEFGGSGE
jgi:hypothetical protein